MSEAKHLAAVVARLTAAGSTALTLAQLSSTTARPEHYNQVVLTERPESVRRVGGSGGSRSWRVLILSVGKRYGDAQNEREIARSALRDQSLTVDGVETGALSDADIEHGPIVPDEGWFSGASEFVFTS